MEVEAILAAVRAVVREELGSSALKPLAVNFTEAARLLACSSKHVSRMVKSGRLLVVDIEGARRIPMAEIERLASPVSLKSSGASEERVRFDAAKAVAKLKELRRKR